MARFACGDDEPRPLRGSQIIETPKPAGMGAREGLVRRRFEAAAAVKRIELRLLTARAEIATWPDPVEQLARD